MLRLPRPHLLVLAFNAFFRIAKLHLLVAAGDWPVGRMAVDVPGRHQRNSLMKMPDGDAPPNNRAPLAPLKVVVPTSRNPARTLKVVGACDPLASSCSNTKS